MNINLIAYYRFVIITLVLLLQFIVKLPISQRPVMMNFFACHVPTRKTSQLSESGKDRKGGALIAAILLQSLM